jgi:hypothetical protein
LRRAGSMHAVLQNATRRQRCAQGCHVRSGGHGKLTGKQTVHAVRGQENVQQGRGERFAVVRWRAHAEKRWRRRRANACVRADAAACARLIAHQKRERAVERVQKKGKVQSACVRTNTHIKAQHSADSQ